MNPGSSLKNLSIFKFLKKNTGIILTEDSISLPQSMEIFKNQAKRSHFDQALEKIKYQPNKIEKYSNTIHLGVKYFDEENTSKIKAVKEIVFKNLSSCLEKILPTQENPVKETNFKNMTKLVGRCLVHAEGIKAPGVKEFPGDFEEPPELIENVTLSFSTKFGKERLSSGYYLPAGETFLLKVISGDFNQWSVRIGSHCDDLSECDDFSRWPCVTVLKNLQEEMEIFSPFGGLIYLESPCSGGDISISLSYVVESPFFDLTKPETINKWNENRNAPGLWAEIAGEHIIFTSPSSAIRHLENPEEVIRFWDSVVRTHHECRGTNVNDYKRERVVNDIQPSVGYMHSGYPIVTHLDCCDGDYNDCIYDIEKLKSNGCWGLFHGLYDLKKKKAFNKFILNIFDYKEIGHNLQRDEWTFDGSVEVTVNIFSMHAYDAILRKSVNDITWLEDQKTSLKKYFACEPTYDDWQRECCVAVFLFAQLIKNFGWDSMKQFMKEYEESISKGTHLPQSNQDKIDQWILRYSKIIGKNVTSHFQMFGLPVSNEIEDELKEFPSWRSNEIENPLDFFV